MIKIPTLFERDPAQQFRVIPRITLGCDWVLSGKNKGFPTVKIDGATVKVAEGLLYRKLKPATATTPAAYTRVIEGDPDYPQLMEAFATCRAAATGGLVPDGIYEAFGPKIAGNHHNCEQHNMVRIAPADLALMSNISSVSGIKRGADVSVGEFFATVRQALEDSPDIEGIVWHQEEQGQLVAAAKIKRKDFGLLWPVIVPVELHVEGC